MSRKAIFVVVPMVQLIKQEQPCLRFLSHSLSLAACIVRATMIRNTAQEKTTLFMSGPSPRTLTQERKETNDTAHPGPLV